MEVFGLITLVLVVFGLYKFNGTASVISATIERTVESNAYETWADQEEKAQVIAERLQALGEDRVKHTDLRKLFESKQVIAAAKKK